MMDDGCFLILQAARSPFLFSSLLFPFCIHFSSLPLLYSLLFPSSTTVLPETRNESLLPPFSATFPKHYIKTSTPILLAPLRPLRPLESINHDDPHPPKSQAP